MDTNILLENGTNELEILEFMLDDNCYGINVAKIKEIILVIKIVTVIKVIQIIRSEILIYGKSYARYSNNCAYHGKNCDNGALFAHFGFLLVLS